MAEVIINGEKFEASQGETLLDVARRNGAHVGFTCSNRGICTFCECKVLDGEELLSEPMGIEKDRLSTERLENGSRLSCLATIEAEGRISVVSRSEKVKQQFLGVFNSPTPEERRDNLATLVGSMKQSAQDYLSMYPYVFKSIASKKVGVEILNPFKDLQNLVKDGSRVVAHQLDLMKLKSEKKSDKPE